MQFFENNEIPICEKTGKCKLVQTLFPDRERPFKLLERNRDTAEIFRRTIQISNVRQFKVSKKGKDSKLIFVPTMSHLEFVINNYHTVFTKGERSNMISKLIRMYNILFGYRISI